MDKLMRVFRLFPEALSIFRTNSRSSHGAWRCEEAVSGDIFSRAQGSSQKASASTNFFPATLSSILHSTSAPRILLTCLWSALRPSCWPVNPRVFPGYPFSEHPCLGFGDLQFAANLGITSCPQLVCCSK